MRRHSLDPLAPAFRERAYTEEAEVRKVDVARLT
jgi:hypothetical protein